MSNKWKAQAGFYLIYVLFQTREMKYDKNKVTIDVDMYD